MLVCEWQRDFNTNYAHGGLANLTVLRLPYDHTGNFGALSDWAGNHVDTVELDEADNDYAVGLVVQTIANSIYKNDTLIFVIEDDAQDVATMWMPTAVSASLSGPT